MNPQRETEMEDPELAPGDLILWRVGFIATVEVAAFSRQEAQYAGATAVAKAATELLRPYRIEIVVVLERSPGAEPEQKEEKVEAPKNEAAVENEVAQGFVPDPSARARWIKEMVKVVSEEVTARLSGQETKPGPIPLREQE